MSINASPGSAASAEQSTALHRIGIPHHLQDKQGFCGAACIMMLMEDAFQESLRQESQSSIMKRIKAKRDELAKTDQLAHPSVAGPPAECHYAWHASPRELAAVLNDLFTRQLFPDDVAMSVPSTEYWKTVPGRNWTDVRAVLGEKLKDEGEACGGIALVWDASLGVRHPHWVVIERYDSKKRAWLIADPSAAGRPDTPSRYESVEHYTVKSSVEGPFHCHCVLWRDSRDLIHAASKNWIPEGKLEDLLDEAAARSGGLRHLIVRNFTPDPQESEIQLLLAKALADGGEAPEPSLQDQLRKSELDFKIGSLLVCMKQSGMQLENIAADVKNTISKL